MKKWIYHKNNIIGMVSDEKLQEHGTMEEFEIEIPDADIPKINHNNFLMRFDGKNIVFEKIFNKETIKEELKNADTIEKLKQIIQKIIN